MNIFLKVYLILAAIALFGWIKRHAIYRICYSAKEIGAALLDVGCQAYIDFTNLFKRKAKTTELDESEKFYHS